jgi:hypothetical protein
VDFCSGSIQWGISYWWFCLLGYLFDWEWRGSEWYNIEWLLSVCIYIFACPVVVFYIFCKNGRMIIRIFYLFAVRFYIRGTHPSIL